MGELRLYKDIYRIVHSASTENYVLISAYTISAVVKKIADNSTIETPQVYSQILGQYYVSLTPSYYEQDLIYEVNWSIQYVNSGPVKTLKNRFVLNQDMLTSRIVIGIECEVGKKEKIEYVINPVK